MPTTQPITTSTSTTTVETTTTTRIIPPPGDNWNWGAAIAAFLVVAITLLLGYWFYNKFKELYGGRNYVAVNWKSRDTLGIKSGPSWFYYDNLRDSLKTSKVIEDDDKLKLLALVRNEKINGASYSNAIDLLAFESVQNYQKSSALILIMTALCGALGVQLRSITNFVGVACFKNDFQIKVWWPWYFLRPFGGLIIGPILYMIFQTKLMPSSIEGSHSNIVIIAVCILAGYGSEDFLFMLRVISKRVFGAKEEK